MSKIICDICGTVYPDNATACPICGYPRQEGQKAVLDEPEKQVHTTKASGSHVKGGKFSSKNVKKRQDGEFAPEPHHTKKAEHPRQPEIPTPVEPMDFPIRAKASSGLKTVTAVLAVAVIVVGGYIAYRFIKGADAYDQPTTVSTSEQTPDESTSVGSPSTTVPSQAEVPCTALNISDETITFEGIGRAWRLSVTTMPQDTTEKVTYTSSNESVATVNEDGRVTSVGPGSAVITITCGSIVRECKVICDFDDSAIPTDASRPTGPDSTETTGTNHSSGTVSPTEATQNSHYKDSNWKLNNEYGDVTLIVGEEFSLELHNDAGETANVTWSADREGVVSINGNAIKGEYVGMVDVSATIDGKTYTCIVRVIDNR